MITAEFLEKQGYFMPRRLADGRWIGLRPMIYTFALCVDLDEWQFAYRYCYQEFADAVIAAGTWTGIGDAPGDWIVRKGLGADLPNPNRAAEGVVE